MIELELEFNPERKRLFWETLFSLAENLRPTHVCENENDAGLLISDNTKFIDDALVRETGLMLRGIAGTYNVSLAGDKPIRLNSFLEIGTDATTLALRHLATAKPFFGFACLPEEREHKNRIVTVQGENHIETWVGRDYNKYVPGFYWMTLFSDEVLENLEISKQFLEENSLKSYIVDYDTYIYQFYFKPENWTDANEQSKVLSSLGRVFNAHQAKVEFDAAKNFVELNTVSSEWR